ncbi:MAG TPA: TetR/AcrR family transcriptional regulator [Solirubrobacteraceae bacterium]|jgi:AcrR family transcriptional regulator|nr:TetR/AcrR family transcriptional regulator [Solirubrobacteraceae bacterium]
MAATRTPRIGWINAGLRALAAAGPDAVRIESLAQALGVSKGGFYWHFDGRPALLKEMLDQWERVMIDEVIERVEDEPSGDARAKLRRLFALATDRSRRGNDPHATSPMEIELAIRDWARRDQAVATRLAHVDNRRMEYMRKLFGDLCPDAEEVEARCLLAFSLFVGNHFIAADHGAHSRAEILQLTLKRLLA